VRNIEANPHTQCTKESSTSQANKANSTHKSLQSKIELKTYLKEQETLNSPSHFFHHPPIIKIPLGAPLEPKQYHLCDCIPTSYMHETTIYKLQLSLLKTNNFCLPFFEVSNSKSLPSFKPLTFQDYITLAS
jgi:hypothetical protein